MEYPELGDIITNEKAIKLCDHFGLTEISNRIKQNPDQYRQWEFDGCSMVPDKLLGIINDGDWESITYQCCLPHDLQYAYGTPGDDEEKSEADIDFFNNLRNKTNIHKVIAVAFKTAVEIGGIEELGTDFSWGYANI